jgi:hypothetical protein
MTPWTALDGKHLGDRIRIVGAGRQAVDGFGREADQPTGAQDVDGPFEIDPGSFVNCGHRPRKSKTASKKVKFSVSAK